MANPERLEDVEIIRRRASSKAECDAIKSDLESRGFRVFVRKRLEPEIDSDNDSTGANDYAELLAEKRTILTEADIEARRLAQEREENATRKASRIFVVLVWLAIILVGLVVLRLLSPLILAILGLGH